MKVKVATYETVPPDVYSAEVIEVVDTTTLHGNAAKFRFRLIDREYGGVLVTAIASVPELGIGPRSKLYGWLKALGIDPAEHDEIDLSQLVGRRCRLKIEHQERDGLTYNRVADVLPPARPQRQRQLEPAPEPEDDAPFDVEDNLRC
jgi:hypothetical protein